MKQTIERNYYLDGEEVRQAIYDYLKKIDRPVPSHTDRLGTVKFNASDGSIIVGYSETLDFTGE